MDIGQKNKACRLAFLNRKCYYSATTIILHLNPPAMDKKKTYMTPAVRTWERVAFDTDFLKSSKNQIDDWYEDEDELDF
jgi:hypothetical protein